MIIIEKGSKIFLPKKFRFINNVCAYLYDQITEILSDTFYKDMAGTSVDFKGDEKVKEVFHDDTVHPLDALLMVNKLDELEIIVTKHVVMSIIADMVNFIYESIVIAQKGKMSVAYALLRKPFTDQLLILEQILVDRKDFIDRYFHDGNPKKYDPSAREVDKKTIVHNAVRKLNSVNFSADIIYELRYDKASVRGINSYTNHALHIVTNDKDYKTENQGLNFTFPIQDDDLEDFLSHYYYSVSILLLYAASVADKIVFELIENKDYRKEFKLLERLLASIMLYDTSGETFAKTMYKVLSKLLITECMICKNINKFTKRDFDSYFYNHYFSCKKCYNPIIISESALIIIGQLLNPT